MRSVLPAAPRYSEPEQTGVLIEILCILASAVGEAGMARGKAVAIVLSAAERDELSSLVRRQKTGQALAMRARIVLLAGEGLRNAAIAGRLGLDHHAVGRWRGRVARRRVDGLLDEPRPGAPRKLGDDAIAGSDLGCTLGRSRRGDAWSLRSMASVRATRALDDPPHPAGLRPAAASSHDLQAFRAIRSSSKVRDIVGLYLQPARPRRGAVRRREEPCVDGPRLARG